PRGPAGVRRRGRRRAGPGPLARQEPPGPLERGGRRGDRVGPADAGQGEPELNNEGEAVKKFGMVVKVHPAGESRGTNAGAVAGGGSPTEEAVRRSIVSAMSRRGYVADRIETLVELPATEAEADWALADVLLGISGELRSISNGPMMVGLAEALGG